MEIIKAETAGFCFGVAAASDKAFKLAEERVQGNIYTFGPLIHNAGVVKKLENMGVGVVEDTSDPRLEGASVIIRAHGVAPQVKKELEARGCKITDATCPFVGKIHRLVKKEYGEGKQIVIIGDPEHPEVKGINGCCDNTAYIIKETDDVKGLESWVQEGKSVSIVTQTTFNIKKFGEISHLIEKTIDKHEFFDTICSATSLRQKEAEQIASKVDLMIIVGGRNSSNTLKLYEICSQLCDNVKLVESADELEAKWFKNIRKAGVTAGASTPGWSIEEVIGVMSDIDFIENEAKNTAEENFESMLEDTLTTVTSGEIVKGAINKIDDKGVYVDLGFKYEGFIAIDEFAPVPGIETELPKVGDEVEAKVVRVSDKDCEVILSKRRIDYAKNMQVIEESFNNKTPITVKVTEAIKGGVIAFAGSVRIFIPASQTGLPRGAELDELLKKKVEFTIIEVTEGKKRAVGSIKAVQNAKKAEAQAKFWDNANVGDVYVGKVKSLTSFGAFVDLGGIDGMVHISELSWKRIKHPSEVVAVGDTLEVYIKDLSREDNRISLGFKKAEDNPWEIFKANYNVGDVVKATIVSITSFGAFAKIVDGVDGLIHISQIADKKVENVKDILTVGDEVDVKIIDIDAESHRISISMRALLEDTEEAAEDEAVEEDAE